MKPTPPTSTLQFESIRSSIGRYSLYTFLILAFAASLPLLAQFRDAAAFKEGGAIEWMQLGLLVAISFTFFKESIAIQKYRQAFAFLGGLAAFAAIREMDAYLDVIVPWLGWKIGYLVILAVGFYGFRNRKTLHDQAVCCVNSRAFTLLWAGFIIAIPFAQLVGNGTLLNIVMGEGHDRDYRRMIEELGELMGYALILIGNIELIRQKRMVSRIEESSVLQAATTSSR